MNVVSFKEMFCTHDLFALVAATRAFISTSSSSGCLGQVVAHFDLLSDPSWSALEVNHLYNGSDGTTSAELITSLIIHQKFAMGCCFIMPDCPDLVCLEPRGGGKRTPALMGYFEAPESHDQSL